MFYVYVLKSAKTGGRYVGSCRNVDAGHSKATRRGAPWSLLHTERFVTRREAVNKERYYKTGRGRDELDRLAL
jgi:putative endonuclease